MPSSKGYTLIEILVVMAIMTLVSVIAFTNYAAFKEDTTLNNSLADVQSFIRLAQTNATSSVKCNNSDIASWYVEFATNRTDINLRCTTLTGAITLVKTRSLKGVNVDLISPCTSSFPTNVVTINFAAPLGAVTFVDPGASCIGTGSNLVITLKNTKTNNTKTVTIDKGGGVN